MCYAVQRPCGYHMTVTCQSHDSHIALSQWHVHNVIVEVYYCIRRTKVMLSLHVATILVRVERQKFYN